MPKADANTLEKDRLMPRRVPLDNVEHQHLRVIDGAGDPARVNQALVVVSEFEPLQREYPILFRKDSDGGFQALVILGFDRQENLFLDGDAWSTRAVPATLRRGPFFLAAGAQGEGDAMIVVDLDDPRLSDSQGEPLFLEHGGAGAPLQRAAEALRIVHEGLDETGRMFALFQDLDLIAPIALDIELGDGTQYSLPGFFTVSADRLAALDGEALKELNRSGFLAAAVHARSSLANLQRLADLKARLHA